MPTQFTAITIPIEKGKTPEFQKFIQKLNTEFKTEFTRSRKNAGLHERTFLQRTPERDFVIITLEGNDPINTFTKMMNNKDEFTTWFVQQVRETHGIDITKTLPGSMPEMIADSGK